MCFIKNFYNTNKIQLKSESNPIFLSSRFFLDVLNEIQSWTVSRNFLFFVRKNSNWLFKPFSSVMQAIAKF